MPILVFRSKWLRRLVMVLIGVGLGTLYFNEIWDDSIYTPFAFGFVVGLLSTRVLEGYINSMIVLISMISVVVISSLAANLGGLIPIDWEVLLNIIANTFQIAAFLFLPWIPAVAAGFFARYWALRIDKKTKPN